MRARCLFAAALLAAPAPLLAQTRVAIGPFTSTRACTTYILNSGSERSASAGYVDSASAARASAYANGYEAAASAAAASRYRAGSASSYERQWRQDLVRDCTSQFTGLRGSLAAALGGAGRVVVVPPGTRGALVLSGRVSPAANTSTSYADGDQTSDASDAGVTVEFALRGAGGAILFGDAIEQSASLSEDSDTGYSRMQVRASDTAAYARLQRGLAGAVARAVAFHFEPMRVVAVAGERARVNYGAPLLEVGMTVLVDAGPAEGQILCTIVSTGNGFADIESPGGRGLGRVPVGSQVAFAEDGSAQAGGRILQGERLP